MTKVSEAEAERLYALIQECSEVQKEATKVLIHGWENYNPFDKDKVTNRVALSRELGDLTGISKMMERLGDLHGDFIMENQQTKWERFLRWSRHQLGSKLEKLL